MAVALAPPVNMPGLVAERAGRGGERIGPGWPPAGPTRVDARPAGIHDGGRGEGRGDCIVAGLDPRRPRHERVEGSRTAGTVHEDALVRALYAEHAGPLFAFALRLTAGDRQRAEDVVQETLLRAWRNAHKLDERGSRSLRPWLMTVARRIVIDDHRSRRARPPETDDERLATLASADDDTERVLWQMTITDALRSLSQPHREVLIETYFRGRTVEDAAHVLEVPVGTVKSRVYYALRALRVALEERGVTP